MVSLEETISSGVIEPRVVVGASDACVKVDSFSGQLLGGQFAAAGSKTGWSRFGRALLLPGVKVLDVVVVLRILDPLDDLGHSHKVDIIVGLNDFINPVEEGIKIFRVILEPGGMEE